MITLREHADDLESGRVLWSGRKPTIGAWPFACLLFKEDKEIYESRRIFDIHQVCALTECIAWSGTAYRARLFRADLIATCIAWNDHPDTTLDEAVALLRAAADLLDE